MQLYSYTMQFANRLPFSQHLVPRYSDSPAPPPISEFGGTVKIIFRLPNSAPSFRHWVMDNWAYVGCFFDPLGFFP